jgi:hypothetical protein
MSIIKDQASSALDQYIKEVRNRCVILVPCLDHAAVTHLGSPTTELEPFALVARIVRSNLGNRWLTCMSVLGTMPKIRGSALRVRSGTWSTSPNKVGGSTFLASLFY